VIDGSEFADKNCYTVCDIKRADEVSWPPTDSVSPTDRGGKKMWSERTKMNTVQTKLLNIDLADADLLLKITFQFLASATNMRCEHRDENGRKGEENHER